MNTPLEKLGKQMVTAHMTGPQQMYVKALIAEVKAHRLPGGSSDHAVRRSIFKHHHKPFRKLGPGQISVLRVRAAAHVSKKLETLEESRDHVVSQTTLLRARREQERSMGSANQMESARF